MSVLKSTIFREAVRLPPAYCIAVTCCRAKKARAALVAALAKELDEAVAEVKEEAAAAGPGAMGFLGDEAKMAESLDRLKQRRVKGTGTKTTAAAAGAMKVGKGEGPFALAPAAADGGGGGAGLLSSSDAADGKSDGSLGSSKLLGDAAAGGGGGGRPSSAAAGGSGGSGRAELAASMSEVNFEVMKAQGRLDATAAAERIIGLFLAAVDTTRYFLFITMVILSELPEEMEKLREEQQEVRGLAGGGGVRREVGRGWGRGRGGAAGGEMTEGGRGGGERSRTSSRR